MHSSKTHFGAGSGQQDPPGTGLRAGGVVAQSSVSVWRWRFYGGGVKGAEQEVSAELPRAPYPRTGCTWPLDESKPLAGVSPCPTVRADPPWEKR